VTSWNKGAERIFGYDSEVLGKPISLLAWPGMKRICHDSSKRSVAASVLIITRQSDVTKTGTQVFVSLTLSAILDAENNVIGISKVSRDISSRKAADETLARQARLLDQVYEPILVRTMDDRIVYWNKGAERVYGWTAAEALGKNSHDFLKREFFDPEPLIPEVLNARGDWEGELSTVTRDGELRTMLSRWKKQRGTAGWEILETSFDITERKLAFEREEETRGLLLAENRFRELIENAPDAILQVDPTGKS
jgi:PAS domain S-box-containing protein